MRHAQSFMDPPSPSCTHARTGQGEVVEARVQIFHIETTLNNDMFPGPFDFLAKREWDWTARDQATFAAISRALDMMPPQGAPSSSAGGRPTP